MRVSGVRSPTAQNRPLFSASILEIAANRVKPQNGRTITITTMISSSTVGTSLAMR
jgi:hypothetical protein